ncbi:MAG: hypothetical protein OXJ52_00840 [Oligoflexia bacterium]|nr:hypothetical protein [Oligoflexia bacterium]
MKIQVSTGFPPPFARGQTFAGVQSAGISLNKATKNSNTISTKSIITGSANFF